MGQSWLVYALVLAVQDGLDLDIVPGRDEGTEAVGGPPV
jgi:hypothetical protein